MKKIERLQIGHTTEGRAEMMVQLDVTGDHRVELTSTHRHSFYALYWIHEGEGTHTIDFCDYELRPGRLFFLRPEQVHTLSPVGRLRYSALQFTELYYMLFAKTIDADMPVFIDVTDEDSMGHVSFILRQIDHECRHHGADSTNILRAEVHLLMLLLQRCWHRSDSDRQPLPDVIRRYRQLVEQHFRTEHHVAWYASQLCLTANYLNVLVQRHLAQTALSVINQRIVLEVRRRLMDSQLSVSEIAYSVGFYEMSYFTRFFGRHTGQTPIQFRQAHTESAPV